MKAMFTVCLVGIALLNLFAGFLGGIWGLLYINPLILLVMNTWNYSKKYSETHELVSMEDQKK